MSDTSSFCFLQLYWLSYIVMLYREPRNIRIFVVLKVNSIIKFPLPNRCVQIVCPLFVMLKYILWLEMWFLQKTRKQINHIYVDITYSCLKVSVTRIENKAVEHCIVFQVDKSQFLSPLIIILIIYTLGSIKCCDTMV